MHVFLSGAMHQVGCAGSAQYRGKKVEERYGEDSDHHRRDLFEAIEAGGSTISDFRGVSGSGDLGYFPHRFTVFNREGEPCKNDSCAGTIRRIVQSGRSTFYCPKCQR